MARRQSPRFSSSDDLLDAPVAVSLDLHGRSATEAAGMVESFIAAQSRARPRQVVRIITGKGKGSGSKPVLRGTVASLLKGKIAPLIAEFDRDVDEGSFLVRLR